MLAVVEAPLLGAEGEALKRLPHAMPDEYETWVDAQLFSAKASQQYANYKDVIFPLERTTDQTNSGHDVEICEPCTRNYCPT
jgi:hypothetical protein